MELKFLINMPAQINPEQKTGQLKEAFIVNTSDVFSNLLQWTN
jgi:hypothetical protein